MSKNDRNRCHGRMSHRIGTRHSAADPLQVQRSPARGGNVHRISPIIRNALISGSAASAVSTATLALNGLRANASPYAPTNAISHWLWGERAARQNRPSLKYTLLAYVTHH